MSVIAWDGKTIAADVQGTNCDMRFLEHKMMVKEGTKGVTVCAWTGIASYGRQLAFWYFDGADENKWPEFQKDKDDWARLIVVDEKGCRFYERTPFPFLVADSFCAWGSGRDFAMGAMGMGATAQQAVEVTNRFSTTCGLGVEHYQVCGII